MTFPFIKTSPDVGLVNPETVLKAVVFPHPLGPRKETSSPLNTSRLRGPVAFTFPYHFSTSLSSRIFSVLNLTNTPYIFSINTAVDFLYNPESRTSFPLRRSEIISLGCHYKSVTLCCQCLKLNLY